MISKLKIFYVWSRVVIYLGKRKGKRRKGKILFFYKTLSQIANLEMEDVLTMSSGKCGIDNHEFMDSKSEARETLMTNLVFAKEKLDEITQKTLKLVQENKKINNSVEQVRCRAKTSQGISCVLKCDCGEEYKVEVNL
ncbi:uncharacterized protein LOC123229542 isoform X7 [Mangifera indica]|uniref:uncharacterized protein LOC123229542 isoform X7 n=1 Tax=Mangifera indica TaxID=29780 RepID=UPI001CFBFCC7|nr:uncharacterized protein LOC123229542 isoform X7 [Mangifera indica]